MRATETVATSGLPAIQSAAFAPIGNSATARTARKNQCFPMLLPPTSLLALLYPLEERPKQSRPWFASSPASVGGRARRSVRAARQAGALAARPDAASEPHRAWRAAF